MTKDEANCLYLAAGKIRLMALGLKPDRSFAIWDWNERGKWRPVFEYASSTNSEKPIQFNAEEYPSEEYDAEEYPFVANLTIREG